MDKRLYLWALLGWAIFGGLGLVALLSSQAPPEHLVVGFLIPGIFGLMVGGMLGLVRAYKANQRELGRFLLTVIGGTVLLGTLFVELTRTLEWPYWLAPTAAALGSFAGLRVALRGFRRPLTQGEALIMLGAALVLGYDSFGLYILPILLISAVALRHHLLKQSR